ncbi:uncharacterized protein O3C94_007011 [Discoglossus pictus]
MGLKLSKSPGLDGFTNLFYKKFEPLLTPYLTPLFNAILNGEPMTPELNQAALVVFPKEGRDNLEAKNYRPISLINGDVKILAKIMANRISKFLPDLIHKDQAGFIPFREAGDNVRKVLNIQHLAKKSNIPLCLLALDIEMAFDMVEWTLPIPIPLKELDKSQNKEGGEWDAAVIAAQPDLEEFCNFDTGKGCVLTIDEVFVSVKELQRCKDQKKVPWPIGGLVVVPTHETVVQGVGWTYYPIILNFNDFSIPPKCPESQRQWFKQSIQETIIEWTGAGSREKRDTLEALLGGVGTGLGVWNSADIIGLNSRINSLTDGMGHAMKTGGVADSLIVSRLTDNVDDIHTIANNLHLVEENIASIANSIKNEIVGTAIFCSMIGGKLLADLKETIKDIQENKWARQINATRIITSLKRKGVDITEDNLKYSYIEGPDQWMPHGLQSGTIGLILAIPRWEGQAEQLNFIHSIGTLSDGIYKQHFPSKRLATITGLEMDESCCRKSQHRWLCSCVWDKGAEEDGWVQLIKENLVQEVIRIGDIACFIGHSEYRTVDEICLVEEGSCIMVTTTIHVGTHTLFPSRNLTTEMINFTANADWTNLTMKLFPPIPKLTLELHELVKRTKQQLHPISLLLEQQKKEIEITTKNVEHPWWGILTNAETHPVLRTLSLVLMFIQVLTTIIIIYFCVAMKQMRKKLARRIYNNEI